jgi:2-(1,2-epoxy-1,2-dihydrophenyl)acetyl-CoA isomerase
MEHIHLTSTDGVGIITIDRTPRFNSLDVNTARDLRKAGLQMARDEKVRAVIVRGAGNAFCSGADLKYIASGGEHDDLAYLTAAREVPAGYGERFKQILEYLHSTISEIRRAAKPFIAAVDGIAAAGGFGLAMSCDLVLASDRATFEWAYGKTGLTGAESSTFLLPRLVGLRTSMELMLLNPRLSAREALAYGLVTRVFERESFDHEVMAIAQTLAAGPTRAFGVAKALINQAAGVDRIDFHLDQELQHLVRSANSQEFKEGLMAFFEKRPAVFSACAREDGSASSGATSPQPLRGGGGRA